MGSHALHFIFRLLMQNGKSLLLPLLKKRYSKVGLNCFHVNHNNRARVEMIEKRYRE